MMRNNEYKECKLLLNIALIFQMLYLGYVCLLNIFRQLVVFLMIGMKEVDSKVFVDVPYLLGTLLTTGIVILWYCVINSNIKNGKRVTALHFAILYIIFHFGYTVIPNEAFQFQYSYVGDIRFSENGRDLFYDSWSYALNLSEIEQLGKGLFVFAILFLLCALLIYWTKCRYQQNNVYGNAVWKEEEKNIMLLMRIALFFQIAYLGYVFYYNMFRTVVLASHYFGNQDVKSFFDFPYLLGAVLSTSINFYWYYFLSKISKSNKKLSILHIVLMGVTFIMEFFIVPAVSAVLQYIFAAFISSRDILGATYDTLSFSVNLIVKELSALDMQLYALAFFISSIVLYWAGMNYASQQITE